MIATVSVRMLHKLRDWPTLHIDIDQHGNDTGPSTHAQRDAVCSAAFSASVTQFAFTRGNPEHKDLGLWGMMFRTCNEINQVRFMNLSIENFNIRTSLSLEGRAPCMVRWILCVSLHFFLLPLSGLESGDGCAG